jgi:hypothetical protein
MAVLVIVSAFLMLAVVPNASASGEVSSPSSFDISGSVYFPPIGYQGGQGSCAAWALTYYADTYMEAKLNGWTDVSAGNTNHLMSPAWTYNHCNGGTNSATSMYQNGLVAVNEGVATLALMPYKVSDVTSLGSPAAYADAATHKATSVKTINFDSLSIIVKIKDLLTAGTPVTFDINSNSINGVNPAANDYEITLSDYQSCAYGYTMVTHAGCVVGWDDSMTAAGQPDVGAFKIANSWGSNTQQNGYYWISYDAFKGIGNLLQATYLTIGSASVINPSPVITSTPSTSGGVNIWYEYRPTADMTVTWSMSSTAPWLTLSTATGKVFGTPTSSGTFSVVLTATSTQYGTTATQTFSITIAAASGGGSGGGGSGGGGGTIPIVITPEDNGTGNDTLTQLTHDPNAMAAVGLLLFVGLCMAVVVRQRR